MKRLAVLLSVLLSSPALAQMSQFYNSDGTSGTIYGSQKGVQQYYDSQGNTGTIFNGPQSGISQYYFNGPQGQAQSGTIFSTPAPMPPAMQPLQPMQPMTPMQPWTPNMQPVPWGR